MKTAILVLTFTTLSMASPGDIARRDALRATPPSILQVSPSLVHFGSKQIGTLTLRGATIRNTSSQAINLIVTGASLPDDFSFGILPGSTAPVFEPEAFEPHQSCRAVVGFRPSEFWAGQQEFAQLLATATDPVTHEVLEEVLIDFTGTGR
jgi:hypothetical protein